MLMWETFGIQYVYTCENFTKASKLTVTVVFVNTALGGKQFVYNIKNALLV